MVEEPIQESLDQPDYVSDQSDFSASQTLLQPPPTLNQLTHEQKVKRYIVLGVVLFFVIFLIVLSVLPRKQAIESSPSPLPSATPITTTNPMQQVIDRVSLEVQNADLEKTLLPPPQVDMNVEF